MLQNAFIFCFHWKHAVVVIHQPEIFDPLISNPKTLPLFWYLSVLTITILLDGTWKTYGKNISKQHLSKQRRYIAQLKKEQSEDPRSSSCTNRQWQYVTLGSFLFFPLELILSKVLFHDFLLINPLSFLIIKLICQFSWHSLMKICSVPASLFFGFFWKWRVVSKQDVFILTSSR